MRYNIDILDTTSRETLIIEVMQGDSARVLEFVPKDYTIPAGAVATYYVAKPSGLAVYNSAEINGNVVTVHLTAQALAEHGRNTLNIRFEKDGEFLTSFSVILFVRQFKGIDATESTGEANIFDKAVEQAAEQFQEDAEQIAEEVKQSIPADYTALTEEVGEINERLSALKEDLESLSAYSISADGTTLIINTEVVDGNEVSY